MADGVNVPQPTEPLRDDPVERPVKETDPVTDKGQPEEFRVPDWADK